MYHRYHILRCWSSYEYPNLTKDKIKTYFKYSEDNPKYGLYEEWIVLTEEEFEKYKSNHPNHDYLIKILDIN